MGGLIALIQSYQKIMWLEQQLKNTNLSIACWSDYDIEQTWKKDEDIKMKSWLKGCKGKRQI